MSGLQEGGKDNEHVKRKWRFHFTVFSSLCPSYERQSSTRILPSHLKVVSRRTSPQLSLQWPLWNVQIHPFSRVRTIYTTVLCLLILFTQSGHQLELLLLCPVCFSVFPDSFTHCVGLHTSDSMLDSFSYTCPLLAPLKGLCPGPKPNVSLPVGRSLLGP